MPKKPGLRALVQKPGFYQNLWFVAETVSETRFLKSLIGEKAFSFLSHIPDASNCPIFDLQLGHFPEISMITS
jgi:hypothetical protein